MLSFLKNFVREEEGATMVEYGLMVALIAVVVMVAAGILGTGLNNLFSQVNGELPAAPGGE